MEEKQKIINKITQIVIKHFGKFNIAKIFESDIYSSSIIIRLNDNNINGNKFMQFNLEMNENFYMLYRMYAIKGNQLQFRYNTAILRQ